MEEIIEIDEDGKVHGPAKERDVITADIINWLHGAGHVEAANALAYLHVEDRALRGLEPLAFVKEK